MAMCMVGRCGLGVSVAASAAASVALLSGAAGQESQPKPDPVPAVAPTGAPGAAGQPSQGEAPATKEPSSVLDFTMNRIDGTAQSLAAYRGQVMLIVNTASRCGLTPQYAGLQKMYEARKDRGFVILGFPANNFGNQEPGSNEEIAEFCSSTYSVTFPMFEKISVTGRDQHPLYRFLSSQPAPIGGDPKWNFTKFLVDRSGKVVARFEFRVRPDDEEMLKQIDELLAQPTPEGVAPGASGGSPASGG